MTPDDLQSLFSRPERTHASVLSVYLNVDQSQRTNWNRRFEKHVKDLTSSARSTIHDAVELERFQAAAHHIEDFVSAYKPGGRGLALFFDSIDGFFWHHELGVSIHNQARWDRELFLQPLANALDQFERYGVVLADRDHLRLFTVFLDSIEELSLEGFGPNAHLRRVMNAHLRRVVKEVDWLIQNKQVHRLVLAGASEITSELHNLMPKRLALRVIGTVDIPMEASAPDVLSVTRALAEEYERNTEVQTVKEIVQAAGRNERTVTGLGRTLKAVNSDRVWEQSSRRCRRAGR